MLSYHVRPVGLRTMLYSAFALCYSVIMSPDPVFADLPVVTFDASRVIECTDVTTESFAEINPNEKLIEAKFRISVLVKQGSQQEVEELLVKLVSPERRLLIVDFAPKTMHQSDVEGAIETIETSEVERSVSASVAGTVTGSYGVGKGQASPKAGVGKVERHTSKETFRRVPEQRVVLTSGTTNFEHGVVFKFRPSQAGWVEGMKEFTCRFVVPGAWRGDWAIVTCEARARYKNLFIDELRPCGRIEVAVGLYQQGDQEAKVAADHLIRVKTRGSLLRVKGDREDPSDDDTKGLNFRHLVLKPLMWDRKSRKEATFTRADTPANLARSDFDQVSSNSSASTAPKKNRKEPNAAKQPQGLGETLDRLERLSGAL